MGRTCKGSRHSVGGCEASPQMEPQGSFALSSKLGHYQGPDTNAEVSQEDQRRSLITISANVFSPGLICIGFRAPRSLPGAASCTPGIWLNRRISSSRSGRSWLAAGSGASRATARPREVTIMVSPARARLRYLARPFFSSRTETFISRHIFKCSVATFQHTWLHYIFRAGHARVHATDRGETERVGEWKASESIPWTETGFALVSPWS
jgi:hypothetical protein